ncbi:MAG: PAS domain S-box protein, partial [Magnetococcales bacterium]|nr:PAS domain S-box protein [Magnetococcales bacterium]
MTSAGSPSGPLRDRLSLASKWSLPLLLLALLAWVLMDLWEERQLGALARDHLNGVAHHEAELVGRLLLLRSDLGRPPEADSPPTQADPTPHENDSPENTAISPPATPDAPANRGSPSPDEASLAALAASLPATVTTDTAETIELADSVVLISGQPARVTATTNPLLAPLGSPREAIFARFPIIGETPLTTAADGSTLSLLVLPHPRVLEHLERSFRNQARTQRTATILTLLLPCWLILAGIANRLRQVNGEIIAFSRTELGKPLAISHPHDALLGLGDLFHQLSREMIATRVRLHAQITEKDRAETDLRRLSQAIEQSPVAVVIGDSDGGIDYANPAFTRLTGITAIEILGKRLGEISSVPTLPTLNAEILHSVAETGSWRAVMNNARKGGENYWELNTVSPIRDPEGRMTHILAIKEDISRQIETDQARRQAREAAEAVNQLKNDFLTNITHEFRTPLYTISGSARLILDRSFGEVTEEQRSSLHSILEGTDRLGELITNLMDLARVGTEQFILETRAFELPTMLQNTAASVSAEARSQGLDFSCIVPSELPNRVVGDPGRLRQALLHLLRNAIKFTPEGRVSLR